MGHGGTEFLERLAQGRPEAFEALYDAWGEKLHAYLLGRLRVREDAEDVFQTVWVRLARYRERFRSVENLKAYLFSTARNELARFLEKASRQSETERSGGEERWLEVQAGETEDGGDAKRLRDYLEKLPPDQAEVVSLKVFQELTFAEIGMVQDISPNTAASRYRYALEKLRQNMESIHERP